jgi:hypothetical protein
MKMQEWRHIRWGIFCRQNAGFGVYRFGNGHQYEGAWHGMAWHEGKRQGLGIYTFGNGETQSELIKI